MKKYILTTESGSDLSEEMIEEYDIHIVPMHVTMGNQTHADGSFEVKEVFRFYEMTDQLPKTSGATPEDFKKVFSEIFEKYPNAHIIHIAYSAVTTVSYDSANIAAQEFENISIVDSKHVTIGAAAIVKRTAQYIQENPEISPEEIVAFVEDIRERTHMYFLPKTLRYLKAGGRVSSVAFFSANLLNIHPTIVLENGYLVPGKKYRGSFERSLKRMVNDFFKNYSIDLDTLLIVGSPEISNEKKKEISSLLRKFGVKGDPNWMKTGAVIASHGGPEAIGIAGIEKK
ncbi:MAG: DegV family protein [Atopostipes suicloacalis]|nr:DegV family protein [Atopostipes suicloacalis]MDN6731329.1 DegV family protein [Atopostipes suicloacalis]